ncbi:hypothetical protein C2W64_02455 [Brevibacillus laterosporus]|nr:GNAT family N-acetyltransferase [Brevibacillus laterosporus]RAP24888.1 hypothetical protein C2W64_02455 [Brevibacillus laterosporus]
MIIRKFKESDTEQLVSLFYETVHTSNAQDYSQEQLDAWAPEDERVSKVISWQESLRHNSTYVAEIRNTLVGFCDMTAQGHLDRLYIHKDFQRQGIASALLGFIERKARERALVTITTEASITAKPFFEHHGYQTVQAQAVTRRGILLVNYQMNKEIMPILDEKACSNTQVYTRKTSFYHE